MSSAVPFRSHLSSWAGMFGLLLSAGFLSGQSLIKDVGRLADAIEPPPVTERLTQSLRAPAADSINLMGILAAYGYPSRSAALKNSYNAEAILQRYRHNPYLKKIFSDSSVLAKLRSDYDSAGVRHTIFQIRQGRRERILQTLSSGDVYAENRMFRTEALIADYQLPRINNTVALQSASKNIETIALGDPASFTATFLTGLADWIGNRAQKEFVQTFLLQLQQDLSDKQLNILFPNTYQYLGKLNLVNYKAIITNARLAFAKDLNTLSLNLSNYLFKSRQLDENDPLSFSLLLIFRLVDLTQRQLQLPDILAYANGEFSRRRFESEKILHDNLVAQPQSPPFEALREAFKIANASLINTYDSLILLQETVANRLSRIDAANRRRFPELNQRVIQLQEQLDSFNYAGLFRDEQNRLLSEVNAFLEGRLDYATLEAYPSFNTYSSTFETPPPDSAELRGVGLTMIRELLRRDQGNYPILIAMEDYFQLLRNWEEDVNTLAKLVDTLRRDSTEIARQLRQELMATIEEEKMFWEAITTEHEWRAFDYLIALAQNVRAEPRSPHEQIVYLDKVENLLVEHITKLKDQYPQGENDPYFLKNQPNPKHQKIRQQLANDSLALNDLQAALHNLEMTGDNEPLLRSYENVSIFSNTLQAATQLLYCLAVNQPGDTTFQWVKPTQITPVLNDDIRRDLFLGLLYQRISTLTGGLSVDSRGLAGIATQIVQQLAILDTAGNQRSGLLTRIEFASNVLNSILETPLLRTHTGDDLQSLAERFKNRGISKVPAINRGLAELFRHTENKNFRYALDNAMELIDLFNAYPEAKRKRDKWLNKIDDNETSIHTLRRRLSTTVPSPEIQEEIVQLEDQNERLEARLLRFDSTRYRRFRNSIFRYGHFMADVAAADRPEAIQGAMQTVALPSGSSQNKRLRPFSIELNAYFGGTLAYEHIIDKPEGISNNGTLNSYGLFVPVGIAISKRLSPKSNLSLSLFLPIIDLGTLTAYHTNATDQGIDVLPDLSFANVLSPGAHLLFNIPKSPFFLGGGVQYGPNIRKIETGGELVEVRALRGMFTFGVDVPILSFSGN